MNFTGLADHIVRRHAKGATLIAVLRRSPSGAPVREPRLGIFDRMAGGEVVFQGDLGPLGLRRRPQPPRYGAGRSRTRGVHAIVQPEFIAYLAMLAGLLIAGAITKASSYGAHHDVSRADRVWLYAVILTVGYMLSRG
jgi:hypothetical protein